MRVYIEACKRAACAGSGTWLYNWHDVNDLLLTIGWKWVETGDNSSKIVRDCK